MRLSQIEKKARALGIKNTWNYTRKELIKEIQQKEGHAPCFATLKRGNGCVQFACCWREDCLK